MSSRNALRVLIVCVIVLLLYVTGFAQQRFFARVAPNREIAGTTAELYSPAAGTFKFLGTMTEGRERHTATLLPNGKVLIAGGFNGSYLDTAELYDPASNTFTATGEMNEQRRSHTATLLSNGKVLIAGGTNGEPLDTAEVYDPGTGEFKKTSSNMTAYRTGHTATLLKDGTVFIAGGYDGTNYSATAEIYDPVSGKFTATDGSLAVGRQDHAATLLQDGKVLITGGRDVSSVLDLAETFEPDSDRTDDEDDSTFTSTANDMTIERLGHTSTLLPSGKVLIAGGRSEDGFLSTAEVWDPNTREFSATASMSTARYMHVAVALPDGRILVTGGNSGNGALATTEIYDPTTATFSPGQSMTSARIGHAITVFGNGTLFFSGGQNALPLEFDLNLDQTDNVSPNILFSADSRRGFVPYTGSGAVLVFSAETGATLQRIVTGGKPALMTLLKDGRTLAIVSALENRIFVVDMETYRVKATWSFTGATFGFGSWLTLSPDGSVGYISSTGSGELIKFSVDSGKELARVTGFLAPAQITTSPDGALLFLLDTNANEMVCIDAGSLSKKYTIKVRDEVEKASGTDNTSYATFSIFNSVVLSKDGEVAIVASRDGSDSSAAGKFMVFKAATGEVLDVRGAGTQPGFTALAPNGLNWVIHNEATLTIVPTYDPGAAFEAPTAGTNTVGSANVAFSPDSSYAYYASSDDDSAYQQSLTSFAVCGKVLVGDDPNYAVDQPSTVALAPNGQVLAVLDFVAGEIELLRSTNRIAGTKYISSTDRFTGLTLINLSDQPAAVKIYAYDNYGSELEGDDITDPVEITIPARGQYASTVDQIFGLDPYTEKTGWLAVNTDEPKVVGYISTGRVRATWLGYAMDEMDGFPLFRKPLYEWIAPEVSRDGKDLDGDGDKDEKDYTAELNFVNPAYNQLAYDSSRKAMQGVSIKTADDTVSYPTNRASETVSAATTGSASGNVLIVGGRRSSATLDSAEIFSPSSNSFSAASDTTNARREGHTATSLLDGRVLIAGGKDANDILASAETYDPDDKEGDSELFTTTPGSLNVERVRHTATLLSNGRVLIAGGQSSDGINDTAEIFDPDNDVFTLTSGPMTAGRDSHTATLLVNGKVLLAGGTDGSTVTNSAELYDPSRDNFNLTGPMNVARSLHTATRLKNGKVLIVGGYNGEYLASAELYDPMKGTFTTVGNLIDARASHTATLLESGRVLITGGTNGSVSLDSVESFNPDTNAFEAAGTMNSPRTSHTATLLKDGKVLIAGGFDEDEEDGLDTAEVYDPDYGTFTETEELTDVRSSHTATLLQAESSESGYYRMSSTGGLLMTEFYGPKGALAALNGIDLQRWGIKHLYSPQFAIAPGFVTILNLINANGEGADFTITPHEPDGTVIGLPYVQYLAPGEQLKLDLAAIFGVTSALIATGWLEVESSVDHFGGTISFTNERLLDTGTASTFLTSFQLSGEPLREFVIPSAANSSGYKTAIALLNVNADTASYTVELWNPDGTLDRSVTRTLAPGTRTAEYLTGFFPGLPARLDGYIRIRSDRSLHAFGLMHDDGYSYMAALPPMVIPD